MIPASHSPNSQTGRLHFAAGPLDIEVASPAGGLRDVIAECLDLYDVTWTLGSTRPVSLECTIDPGDALQPAQGRYLECSRMNVDPAPDGLRATTNHGAALEGTFTDSGERWRMSVSRQLVDTGWWPEVEDLLGLVLTVGWRRAGWVPVHGAALTDGERGAIVCAAGGGGKTTFMLAMVRHGWRSLGDDKLLLRTDDAHSLVAAIKLMLNVDPAVETWFPEIGDLSGLPEYSAWTVKRRVALESLWPSSSEMTMRPTTIVALHRRAGVGSFELEPMDAADTLATLLRQTVIPNDRAQARWIMSELAACASRSVGVRVIVGDGAYADQDGLARVAEALR